MIDTSLPHPDLRSLYSRLEARQTQIVFGLVVAFHLASAAISGWFGYLSPDSWNYLTLARNFYQFGYPTIDQKYFAVFPCDYPLLIALFAPGLSLAQTLIVSKLINASLWIATYFLLRQLRIAPLLAASLVLLPFTFTIAAMTWSETLMIFALVAAIAGIDAVHRNFSRGTSAFLAAALIVGISSRYAFGFVLASFIPIYALAFRHFIQRRVVLILLEAVFLFALYLAVNYFLTGHMTGMARTLTTDTSGYLVFTFADATSRSIGATLLPFSFIAFLLAKNWRANPLALITALTGLAYITIITVLRIRSQFDPFDERLLGPGWFLLTVSLALCANEQWHDARHAVAGLALLGMAAWALWNAHGPTLLDLAGGHQLSTSATTAIENYDTRFHTNDEIDTVISIGAPEPRPSIAANDQIYYGDRDVFTPQSAPYSRRETLHDFLDRLHTAGFDPENCVVDFSQFSSAEALSDVLDETYRTGFIRWERRFDDDLARHFYDVFRPNTLVPCKDLFSAAATK